MVATSKSEVKESLVSMGQLTVCNDFLQIERYPFEPSIAYGQKIFRADQIDDIDFNSYPPTIKVGDELIFLTREKKEELQEFAKRNNIEILERPMIWGWILEPFLDTEFTPETDQSLTKLLENYGLTTEQIKSLRAEVETQMLKYNFDTMLWEWRGFDASDVLKAMRTKYNKSEYQDFYKRVMKIALLTLANNDHLSTVLTERAAKYLNRLKRDNEFSLDRETVIQYCKQQDFPINEKLVDVQLNFSGYKLTITNKPGGGFLLRLFSKTAVNNNHEIEVYHFDKSYVVDFGAHDTAQLHFYITNSGELCTLGHHSDDTPNIICSSIETFIEQYALRDELSLQAKNSYFYEILNNTELIKRLERDFTTITECSDKYAQWYTNGQLTIERGTWLDRPEFYLHVYGQDEAHWNKFVDGLKQSKIIT
jgi:hypothetical protein